MLEVSSRGSKKVDVHPAPRTRSSTGVVAEVEREGDGVAAGGGVLSCVMVNERTQAECSAFAWRIWLRCSRTDYMACSEVHQTGYICREV